MENSIPDDVWFEIFLHCSFTEIFKFKSVSKVWFSILSNPNFINNWYKLNKLYFPWGLVHYLNKAEEDSSDKLIKKYTIAFPDSHSQFVSHHQNGFSFRFMNPADFPNYQEWKDMYLIGSSNGLVLCSVVKLSNQTIYCVCNPLTRKYVSLPPPPTRQSPFVVTGFMCNNECLSSSLVSTSFKVIRIPKFAVKEFKVEVFCSELGVWNIYHVSCPIDVTSDVSILDSITTHNGVLYWLQARPCKIVAVSVNGNTDLGTCGNDCRLINLPDHGHGGISRFSQCLGQSEGLICYAVVNERERSLSVWVLDEDWRLWYKDNKFGDMLEEVDTLLIGGMGMDFLIKQIKVLGFNPDDRNVVILGYLKYIWAYNTRTKGYEQLSRPFFQRTDGYICLTNLLTFALKPWPTVLPPVSW